MKKKELITLANQLRREREALFLEAVGAEAGLEHIAEEREAEFEERAQEERAARLYAKLDFRAKHEIEQIDAALQRITDSTYGVCLGCDERIPVARLHALPATPFCIDCAKAHEVLEPAGTEEEAVAPRSGPIPGDLSLLSGSELEAALRELVREDKRVDMEELRIVCRHGVVYLDGALPSESEHQIVRKLITDVGGLREIVDRLQIKEILWERSDREKVTPPEPPAHRPEPPQTEDVVESLEDGIEYSAPDEPTSDEE